MRSTEPEIVGVMGPNGAGKTTLFEMIAGSNVPSAGRVVVAGQDMQRVRYRQRDRLAIHYHQSYQVRRFSKTRPSFLLEPRGSAYPLVHLFDEPQFNTQDGYIGFMLDFFRKLRGEGRLVFLCLHPNEPFQLEILREICERFLFVSAAGWPSMPTTPAWWPARTSAAIWACWLRAEHLPPAALETPNSRCRAPQAGRLVERAYRLTAYCRVLGGRNGANA